MKLTISHRITKEAAEEWADKQLSKLLTQFRSSAEDAQLQSACLS